MFKITNESKIYIWGTSLEVRSGGAEVLNLLAATLKKLGVYAKMFSWDMEVYEQADYYKKLYNVDCCSWKEIKDNENTIIVLPECMIENPDNLNFFIGFKEAQFIFWWLSSSFDYADLTKKTSKRIQFAKLKSIEDRSLHLYENEVCGRDILYYGINNRAKLQHGINDLYYTREKKVEKENIILYNAMKPETKHFVEDILIPITPDIKYEAIRFRGPGAFYTKDEMCDIYDKCKLYIDFCVFEGRELMPREACVRDCILFLGNEGNAATFDDYPIPEKYKLNKYDNPYKIADILRNTMFNYDENIKEFSFFKNKCMLEPVGWMFYIYNIFGPAIKKINLNIKDETSDLNYSYIKS